MYCNNNNLTNLNVSHNTALTYFGCSFNSISRLDISHNTALTYLNCGSNSLTSLNLKNGNNANLTYLIADKNPNLSCIQVDNVANSNGYPSWLKDAGASYSTNCNPCTPTTSTTNLSICQSQLPYSWNGLTFTVAGTQTKTGLTNAKGCDSAATLNLSLKYEYPIGTSRVAKSTLCSIGATTTATNSNTLGGGVWTSSNPSIATATVAGNGANITAIANGVATLTYTKTAPTGCVSSASCMVTVVALSSPSAITGSSTVCKNATTALSTTTGGGIWSSQNGYAAISNTGIVTGLSAGTGVIKYTISNAAGCLASATYNISVIGLPAIPSIGYAPGTVNLQYGAGGSFCRGKTFTLVGTPTGGSWSSTGGITINATTGVATTNTVGAASVTYTVATSGCSNSRTISGTISTCAFRGVNNGQLTIDNLQFTMYPNPAKTFFNLNVDMLIGAGQIIVTDLYGKQLKTQPLSMGANTIDVSNLSKGMYFISTITNEGKATKKLVVE